MRATALRPPVFVDAAIHRWRGQRWCHLICLDVDALHAFAERLGMRRAWFQDPLTCHRVSWPHYDLTTLRRGLAVTLGAIEVDRYQASVLAKAAKNAYLGGDEDPVGFLRRIGSSRVDELERWLAEVRA